MWQPLKELLNRAGRRGDEQDVRYFVQDFLREKTHSDRLYCRSVKKGVVEIHVFSPTTQQMVRLFEFELKQALAERLQYRCTSVRILPLS